MQHIRIGSRGSDLALWQANHVKKQLEALGSSVEIKIIVTQGDTIQNLSFDKLEGKGFFTKEIETALLNNEIDLAVHSHKDLETDQPKGLVVAAVSEREDPADLLLIRKEKVDTLQLWSLAEQSIIGTSSARRKSQFRGFRPDAEIKDLRGNVPTRIQKLRDGQYDAILLAKAGVDRLKIELSEFHVERLDPEEFIPAPAQGVLALQIREGDQELLKFLEKMNHSVVQERIAVERKVLNLLQGGCQLPLGVYCAENGIVYVSHCQNWEDGANWFEYETDDHESLPEIIVEDLTSIQD
jgi:hydroxymethylbilane synthase